MKTLFIADTVSTIKESDNLRLSIEMIETLDNMLNEYGVPHFFSLPIDSTEYSSEDYISIHYDSKDVMTFNLIYLLWSKTSRNIEDEKIAAAMKKLSKHYKNQN